MDVWFGPDQFAAFMGAPLSYAEADDTSWTTPCVTDWREADLRLDETPGSVWPELLNFARTAAEQSQGKYLVSTLDMHTNLDALRGMRGTQELCFDLVDCPDEVDRAMRQVRALYAPVYEAVYAAGDMRRGATSWLPSYCEQRYAVVECDVICLLGPRHARRFVIPAIAEEAAYLDHCIYHLDGPDALKSIWTTYWPFQKSMPSNGCLATASRAPWSGWSCCRRSRLPVRDYGWSGRLTRFTSTTVTCGPRVCVST